MSEEEVAEGYGLPDECEDGQVEGLVARTCRWSFPDSHLEARVVEGTLVKFVLSSN